MRAVIQRVVSADVYANEAITGAINTGLMVLLGVEENDEFKDVDYMAEKIPNLRIFEDQESKMNLSLLDVAGEMLVVSQFTLYGDCRKGRRPGFIQAARPEKALELYRLFVDQCKEKGIHVQEGIFQAEMLVRIYNDGPVTLLLDSKRYSKYIEKEVSMIIEKFPSGPLSVNCYLITDNKSNFAFIIDPGGYSERLIESVHNTGSTVLYIILTHGHSDHIGGVQDYAKKFNAQILAYKSKTVLLNSAANNFSKEVYGKAIEFDADIYVDEDSTIQVGDLKLKFIHTPGHSPDGMCILAEGFLFSGDTLFAESVGRTDFPYSSFKDLKESIHDKLFVLPDETKVYPGHMGETTIGHEKRFNPFV